MANLQRIQERINMIPDLIKEVEDLKAVSQASFGGYPVEPSYIAEELHAIEDKITSWKAVTDEILVQEIGDSDPNVYTFDSHWRAPIRDYSFKTRLTKRLQRARTDLRVLLDVAEEREGKEERLDDVWALVHPFITTIAKDRMESGFYADAVENACKALNNRVREIVQAKTGEESDGAKLMQKAFSADNPIIKLEKGTSQSAHDTQLGYMQIFSGVMTGIRNPKAHEIENITREDALRKLIMLSILMYKLDRATELS